MMIIRCFEYVVVLGTFIFFPIQTLESSESSEEKINEQTLISNIGQSVELNCTVDESTETYWKFNGELLVIDDTAIVESNDGLIIPSMTRADFGTYVCYDGVADEPLVKYIIKIKDSSKTAEETSEKRELSAETRITGEDSDEQVSLEIPSKEQLLNRLQSLESNTLLMKSTVEERLRLMEQKLASLLRSLSNSKTHSDSSGSLVIHSDPVADQRVINGEYIAEYTWIIPEIEKELERGNADGFYNIKSPYFYTHRPGYRMRMFFYPNYNNTNATGLFAGLVRGEYDEVLPWPFPHNYQLTIVSHKPNVIDDVANIRLTITNCNPRVFQRPLTNKPPACGFREFITHAKLQRNKRAFFIYGNLVIKIRLFISN